MEAPAHHASARQRKYAPAAVTTAPAARNVTRPQSHRLPPGPALMRALPVNAEAKVSTSPTPPPSNRVVRGTVTETRAPTAHSILTVYPHPCPACPAGAGRRALARNQLLLTAREAKPGKAEAEKRERRGFGHGDHLGSKPPRSP